MSGISAERVKGILSSKANKIRTLVSLTQMPRYKVVNQ